LDFIAIDSDLIMRNGLDGGHTEDSASANVKMCAVAGTFNCGPFEIAFGKGTIVMGTHVFDCVILVIDVEDSDVMICDLDDDSLAGQEFGDGGDGYEFRHQN
jgi:hypothetical protein